MADLPCVAVVGLGYVGLALATAFGKVTRTIGFDTNPERIEALREGNDENNEVAEAALRSPFLTFTANPADLRRASFIIIAVPTPVDTHKQPDLKHLVEASQLVGQNLSPGAIVVYESTVYPGVTEEVCLPILEQESGLCAGRDFKIGYSPERINPGDSEHTLTKIVKVVAAQDEETLEKVAHVYGSIVQAGVYRAPDIKTAEAAKVIENIQRDLNIALMNELALIFHRLGLDTREVLSAARTKWNFLPFEPGLVGGHCLAPEEFIFIRNGSGLKAIQVGTFFEELERQGKAREIFRRNGTVILKPQGIEILSFDPETGKSCFKPVQLLSQRKYNGPVIQIQTTDGRSLSVTGGHPMPVWDGAKIRIRKAEELKPGDRLIVPLTVPEENPPAVFDLISALPASDLSRFRVKPRNGHLKSYSKELRNHLKELELVPKRVFASNTLPLKTYLQLEKRGVMPIPRHELWLTTGRGPSYGQCPAILVLTEELARLIGYYLSEGCITRDSSMRVRFAFHIDEKELIADLTGILDHLGLKYSSRRDRKWKTFHIKVSSRPFALFLKDLLQCGSRSEEMSIPDILLTTPVRIRQSLLAGLLRGDGDVHHQFVKREYTKRGTRYRHQFNNCTVGFFSSSPKLFQQTILLLQGLGFVPSFKKDKPLLRLYGPKQLSLLAPFFTDVKRARIENYLSKLRKRISPRSFEIVNGSAVIPIKMISSLEKSQEVYSLEVEDTHLFITSYGLLTHNCIPVDPYYLTYKAEETGYHPEVILAGRRINDQMGLYVAQQTVKLLIRSGKAVRNADVLVLGVTFKENVRDVRNSRVLDLVQELATYGTRVTVHDPLAGAEKIRALGLQPAPDPFGGKTRYDAVILAVPHQTFRGKDPAAYLALLNNEGGPGVLVDVRGVLPKESITASGAVYWSL